jgi:hypothetical protein
MLIVCSGCDPVIASCLFLVCLFACLLFCSFVVSFGFFVSHFFFSLLVPFYRHHFDRLLLLAPKPLCLSIRYVPRRRDANRKAVIAAAGTILIGIVCVIAVFGVHPYSSTSSLYDDSENKVITDQANDALKNAGVEVDMENHNAFEKAELEKTFTQAIKEKAAEKIIAKQNWEASKSKSSKSSSSSSSKKSSASAAHGKHVDQHLESLYDDSENKVITDQANDALKNAGIEVDMENHNAFEKAELEKTFTEAIKEQKADKLVAKANWEASKSKSSKSSSSSSKSKSQSSSSHHHL